MKTLRITGTNRHELLESMSYLRDVPTPKMNPETGGYFRTIKKNYTHIFSCPTATDDGEGLNLKLYEESIPSIIKTLKKKCAENSFDAKIVEV